MSATGCVSTILAEDVPLKYRAARFNCAQHRVVGVRICRASTFASYGTSHLSTAMCCNVASAILRLFAVITSNSSAAQSHLLVVTLGLGALLHPSSPVSCNTVRKYLGLPSISTKP